MASNNSNFGEISAGNMSIGDIVEWSSWNSEKGDWDMNYGIIFSIKNEIKSNRLVSISNVIPLSNTCQKLEFFTIGLRLVSQSTAKKNKE
jgi:hypothetical protein